MKKIQLSIISMALILMSSCESAPKKDLCKLEGFSPNPCNCLKAQAEENNEQIKACEDKFVALSFQERADWINELSNCN